MSVANDLGYLLFPFAIFQNSLRQRHATWGQRAGRQQYLGALIDEEFQSESRRVLFHEFDSLLAPHSSRQPRLRRLFSILVHASNAHRSSEISVRALLELRENFLRHEAFHAMKADTRVDALHVINKVFRFTGQLLAKDPQGDVDHAHLSQLTGGTNVLTENDTRNLAKGSGTFTWLAIRNPKLKEWSELLREYVHGKPVSSKSSLVHLLNVFADFLLESSPVLDSPREINKRHIRRRADTDIEYTLTEYLFSSIW